MSDIDSLIAEAQNHPDAQTQSDDDIDALLQEAQNHPDAIPTQPRPMGIVGAAQDIIQTPGKMIGAASNAFNQGVQSSVVRDKNGQVKNVSFPEQLLHGVSTATNTLVAPLVAGANQGIKTISDAFSNPYNGQGLLEPFSDQNVINYAQQKGIPLDKLAQLPDEAKKAIGEEAYRNLTDIGNIGLNLVPGVAGFKGAVKGAGVAIRGTGDMITNAGKAAYVQELGLLKPLAKRIAPNLNLAKQKVGEVIKNYNLDSPKGFNSASEKADALFDQKWKQADDLIDTYSQQNPDKITSLDDLTDAAKKEIPDNIRAGERNQAAGVLDNIKGELIDELKGKGIDPDKLTPSQIVDVKRSIGAKYKNFDRSAEPVKEAMYDNFESAVIKKINSFVPEAGKLNLEARDIRFAKDALDEAAGRNNKLGGWIALGSEAAAAIPYAISHPQIAVPVIAGTTAFDLARRGILSGRGASTLMNLGRGIKGVGEAIVGPKGGPILPDRVGWNQTGESPTIANMVQRPIQAPQAGPSSNPTLGNLFNQNLGSGVNIGMPMATRAGLGGAAGYLGTDPNASPQEKARNALIGAAGGAFLPTLDNLMGRRVEGAPGALMAPAGTAEMAKYTDEAAAAQAKEYGVRYLGSLNKSSIHSSVSKEMHWNNDDPGTGSSFIVHEGESMKDALDAHRRDFWGDKYDENIKNVPAVAKNDNLQGTSSLKPEEQTQIEKLKVRIAKEAENAKLTPSERYEQKIKDLSTFLENNGYIIDDKGGKYVKNTPKNISGNGTSAGRNADASNKAGTSDKNTDAGRKEKNNQKVSPKKDEEKRNSTLGSL